MGSLVCAVQDVLGAINAGPEILWNAVSQPSLKRHLAVGIAMSPFVVAEGPEGALFQGGKAALRAAIRTGTVDGISGSQGLALLWRLKKGPVDEVVISAGEHGSIRAAFSRTIDDLTEVVTRVYNRTGKQTGVWIERFNSAGEKVY